MRRAVVWTVCLSVVLGASASEHGAFPRVGLQETAYTLGAGGFSASIGVSPLETRLPRLGGASIFQTLNVGGVEAEREVLYEAEGSLIPIMLGFGVSESTDLYLSGTVSVGTRQKTVKNYYDSPNPDGALDRIYDQPLFDAGIGIKRLLKPDYGDGLPSVAFGIRARAGYASDDFEEFKDDTPEDGYFSAGGDAYIALSASFGELFRAHGSAGLDVSQKMGARSLAGIGIEAAAVPGQLTVVASYAMRRNLAGIESSSLMTIGLQYHFSSTSSAQVYATREQEMYFEAARLGSKPEGLKPTGPMQELF